MGRNSLNYYRAARGLNYMYVNNDHEIILKRQGLNNVNEAEPSWAVLGNDI